MLERLARWLRAAGLDVASAEGTAPDAALRRRAAAEGRVLLTRDRRLAESCAAACHRVRAAAPLAQLAEVAAAFGLAPLVLRFSRCLVCNAELRPAAGEAPAPPPTPADPRRPAVPPTGPLWRCPVCGRVYWEGSHTRRMRRALARAAGDAGGGGEGASAVAPAPPGGHGACSARRPHSPTEPHMSGSPGNTSTGTKGGRPAKDATHDITARHGDDLAHGVRHSPDTGASTSARPTQTGEHDSERHDPDDPASRHENISEA
jgi:hypothetical protein